MRRLTPVVLCMLLLIAACAASLVYIRDSAEQLREGLIPIEQAIKADDRANAARRLDEAKECWQKTARGWKILINHDDVRDIETGFRDLETALVQQDMTEAEKEVLSLGYYISHVPENERIALPNIL